MRAPPASSIKYVRDGRFGDRINVNDLNDFAPRLGIAYQITPKTVLRTGFGIYYVRDIGNAVFDAVRNAPFTVRNNEPAETAESEFHCPIYPNGRADIHSDQPVR